MSFTDAFTKTKTDFFRKSTLHGFKHLLKRNDRTLLERYFWYCVLVIALYCTVTLLLFSWNQFVEEPTVIILENPHFPISLVPFPGISICDLNKISRRKVETFSKELRENQNQVLYSSDLSGLSVIVRHDADDYFYPLVSSSGTIVDVFNAYEFPDVTSGSLQKRLVPVGVEIFLRLSATVIYSMPEVKKYSIAKRKCVFPEESKTMFGARYSRSDCLLDCRIKSMMALCQCVPLTYVTVLNGSFLPQCSFLDIPCLYKYQHKWRRLFPFDYDGNDMDVDKQDSLQCNHCTPSCSSVWYSVSTDFTDMPGARNKNENFSVIHISFQTEYAKRYKHDVVYYWYDIVKCEDGSRLNFLVQIRRFPQENGLVQAIFSV
ncbi:hypothetical protein RN001_010733 [Aquatica leii]|uniref:Sodium channel protein Nach n=1 Tax=Aquatica leii TaxID=1421715 RepID=A0AAN7PWQ2_9COLE|nr:hypothetical protein RN001_010733 [Aquatica leii]